MLKTFRKGGIHPPENKISATSPIQVAPLPRQVMIPLGQHIGAPATPVVAKGDVVKVGTLIAKSSGFISANVHSSVAGTVAKLDEITDASGFRKPVIVIDVTPEEEWEEGIDLSDELKKEIGLSASEIVDRIAACGIVGMGGATFPTNVKLLPPKDATPELIIINAVECEPYLTADHRLMLEHPEEILVGVQILMKAAGVSRAVIGIENNKKDAIQLLQSLSVNYLGIDIMPLKVKYPQGGEKQLIDAVTRKMVASGALPISVGAIVQNVGTAYAVYEAVQKNKPLVERVVTVTGKDVRNPINVLSRIGTPISELIMLAGDMPESTAKVVSGGPMMGRSLSSIEAPVTKGTSGVLLLTGKDTRRKPMRNCIRCAKCVSVCPMGLNPAFLMRDVLYKAWDRAEEGHVFDCIECGSCSYTCPANRPLLDHIRLGKQTVMGIIRSRKS